MTHPKHEYTFFQNGHEGTFDVIAIINPKDEIIAQLYYWDEPDTDEAKRVRESARIICEHLNHWCEPDYSGMAGPTESPEAAPNRSDTLVALPEPRREIASVWGVEDVQCVRPDLNDDQAWMVLKEMAKRENAVIGVCWDVLEQVADDLFGSAPDDE